ncbi:G5 domain-containing protein [Actinoplanes sp. NPDC020271]|uniref:G5 domain-containing protein n=1 Tax=Actinoplanes sp. NPDC020271 TaxID=3363896 RepID=UPI00378AFE94
MLAGTSALLGLLSAGLATAAVVSGSDGNNQTAEQTLAADPGAAHLEEDPEVVSREAAAAEPLPRRGTRVPVQPAPPVAAAQPKGAGSELSRVRAEDPADRTAPRVPRSSRTTAEKPVTRNPATTGRTAAKPAVTTRTDVETQPIPFRTRVVRDDSLPKGFRQVRNPGAPGERTIRYAVTLVGGQPTGRRVLDTAITRQPQPRVIVFGTQEDCGGFLDLCLPLGRTGCPQQFEPDPPAPPAKVDETETGPSVITDEDLTLFDPDAVADTRLEPATTC